MPTSGEDLSIARHHYGVAEVSLFLHFVLAGKVALRAAGRLSGVIAAWLDADEPQRFADWTTGRLWLMRVGLARLRQPKEKADDWLWIVDHSAQLGRERCLVVLGARLSELPRQDQAPCLADMQLLALEVVTDPDKQDVYDCLAAVATEVSPPRAIISDHGADILGGIRLLQAEYPQVADVYDITHKAACLLKHLLLADPRWAEMLGQIGKTRAALQQTEWAFLLPPAQRTKSRYLNLGELLGWAKRTLYLVANEPPQLLSKGDPERLRKGLGWLRGFEDALNEWSQWHKVVSTAEAAVRDQGLSETAAGRLREQLHDVARLPSALALAEEMIGFVAAQSAAARPGESLPGSSEVIESCFGRLKALEKEQSRSGFTALVLGLGALLGRCTTETIKAALESTPVKAVRQWYEENIGQSIQSRRREAYLLAKGATKPG